MVGPNKNALEHLNQKLNDPTKYGIADIEIARDICFDSEGETETIVSNISKTIYKKWGIESKVFRQGIWVDRDDELEPSDNRANKFTKAKFGEETSYSGSKRIKYVVYPRRSKYNDKPCVHGEWRLKSKHVIKTKTGIETIEDLLKFNCEKQFEELSEKFITHRIINMTKLGKWLEGIDGRKRIFTKRQQMKIDLVAKTFCRAYKINTYAELSLKIRSYQKDARGMVGRRDAWDKKVIALGGNYAKFATP